MTEQSTVTFQERFDNFSKALDRLGEVVNLFVNSNFADEVVRDSLIQRFEFTLELSWKLLKDILETEGFEVLSPKSTIKEAANFGLITNYDIWFEMIQARNLSSHTYNQHLATQVSDSVVSIFLPEFQSLQKTIQTKYGLS